MLTASLFVACNSKNSKDKDDRNSNKEKDDYSNSNDKKEDSKGDKDADYNNDKKENTDNTSKNDDSDAGWSRSDENKFMDDCEGTAKQNVGAARANEYCDCMLQRMKKMYSSYTEADRDLAGATQEEINKLAAPCNGK